MASKVIVGLASQWPSQTYGLKVKGDEHSAYAPLRLNSTLYI